MSVSGVSSPTTAQTAASTAKAAGSAIASTNQLNYNDFLQLLMAQLKNQDPTQPMDPSQMVTQLATVSQVGQQVQTNTTLASLLTATSLSQAEMLIGQNVTSANGTQSGQVASVNVGSTGVSAKLTNGETIDLSHGAVIQ